MMHDICGAIKQNQSEVGQIHFFIFLTNFMHPFLQLYFAENPIEIDQLDPKIWAVEVCSKQ